MPDETESTVPFTASRATDALRVACAQVGLKSSGAELIRMGENAVFRLNDPVVVRVARPSTPLADVERTAAVSCWLADAGYPAARLVPEAPRPVVVAGSAVTFWVRAAEPDQYADPRQLGELLRGLHALDEPEALCLPIADPLGSVFRRLERLDRLPHADRDFLSARAYELQDRYDDLDFALPFGVIHGDAHINNALSDTRGRAHLIDLDDFATGPREWDLAVTSLYAERLGWHTRPDYEDFVHAYGFDITVWDGYSVIADIQEMAMVAWLAQNVGHGTGVEDEVGRRIADLRRGGDRRAWRPF